MRFLKKKDRGLQNRGKIDKKITVAVPGTIKNDIHNHTYMYASSCL